MTDANKHQGSGHAALLAALTWWGLMPLYYWQLKAVSATEMLGHRIIWSFSLLTSLIFARPALRHQLGGKHDFLRAIFPAALLSINWIVYIFASISGNALQASLGYFLNPLFSAALGIVFLGERITKLKAVALLLGLAGTGVQCYALGGLPIFAILLAASFSLLGLTRKVWPTQNAIVSTWRETVVMLPLALIYFALLASNNELALGRMGFAPSILMIMAGPLTVVPLALYAYAMPRVSLSESAIFQYVTPTVTFVLALMFFHEKLDAMTLTGYGLIWCGLALAAYASVKRPRARQNRH